MNDRSSKLPFGMKKVPVRFFHEICLWHLKRGAKDTGFPSKIGGFENLLDGVNAVANFNMNRIEQGLPKVGIAGHSGLELALGMGPVFHNEYAKLVNAPDAIPYPVFREWMNDESRENFNGTPDFGALPVAGFGREIWGNRGSYCSTDSVAREVGKWAWLQSKKMLDDMRQYSWGQNGFLLLWGGGNSLDADAVNPDEIVTTKSYTESEIWSLERDHLIWVINELGEEIFVEPKLFHPGWLVAGTTKLFTILAREVNGATSNRSKCAGNIEFAHQWADGEDLQEGFKDLRDNGVFVNCKGRAEMHGNGGIKAGRNLAAEIASKKGVRRGDLCTTPDMDYELKLITVEQMDEVRKSISDTLEFAGVVPETWTSVNEVVVTVGWDVRHAGEENPLTKQANSIQLFDQLVAEAQQ